MGNILLGLSLILSIMGLAVGILFIGFFQRKMSFFQATLLLFSPAFFSFIAGIILT